MDNTRFIVQPDEGATPLIHAFENARESIDILIFRFDHRPIERALVKAVERGVKVRALIAHTSKGGERSLRLLEMRLLKAGVAVCRTGEDLLRYHGKMIVIDRKDLYILGFNFTHQDIERSRSFGLITRDAKLLEEALKLFEADSTRKPYEPGESHLVVSPANAREVLTAFLKDASKELAIYDPNIGDRAMAAILDERAKAGVSIRAIGCSTRFPVRRLPTRMHVRAIVRDGSALFLGSQSLCAAELDKRREIGVILKDSRLCAQLLETFEKDWRNSEPAPAVGTAVPAKKIAKRVAKAVAQELPPLTPVLEEVVRDVASPETGLPLKPEELEETVREAVKEAVKEAVRDAVEEIAPA
jgi:phosphatidylserine/phosphatidylglycerophosphate/cardiolipin synthase-like enzyme